MLKNKSAKKAFTLVEIMIVVLIIGILLAIAVPNFVRARASSRQKACVATLRQIESSKEQWGMDNRKGPTAVPVLATDLVGADKYIKGTVPVCPTTGAAYVPGSLNTDPVCPNPLAPDAITGIDHILNP